MKTNNHRVNLFGTAMASLCLFALASPVHAVLLDDFNRADAPSLGANWTNQSGSCEIISQQASCQGLGISTFNGGSGTIVSADVFSGQSSGYGALVMGYADLNNNLYIKVQNQNGIPGFEAIGFYFGRNGSNNAAWSDSDFLASALPDILGAHMEISLVGTSLNLRLDTDFDSIFDFNFVRNNVPVGLLGTGIGIGGWTGDARIDNFSANVPEPGTLAILGIGLAGLGFFRRRRLG